MSKELVILIIVLFFLGMLIVKVVLPAIPRRAGNLERYAARMGLSFSRSDRDHHLKEGCQSSMYTKAGTYSNVMYREGSGGTVKIFDYYYLGQTIFDKVTTTGCLWDISKKPFSGYVLVRRQAERISKTFIHSPIRNKEADRIKFDEYPEFNREYYVISAKETNPRSFLDDEMIKHIVSYTDKLDPAIEISKNMLLITTERCHKQEEFVTILEFSALLYSLYIKRQNI